MRRRPSRCGRLLSRCPGQGSTSERAGDRSRGSAQTPRLASTVWIPLSTSLLLGQERAETCRRSGRQPMAADGLPEAADPRRRGSRCLRPAPTRSRPTRIATESVPSSAVTSGSHLAQRGNEKRQEGGSDEPQPRGLRRRGEIAGTATGRDGVRESARGIGIVGGCGSWRRESHVHGR